jgi:N-acetylmuramoyl-L-alanine amidase
MKMKIGLRAGHSDNCTGAIGILDEHDQMKLYYQSVKSVLEKYGHVIIDCNSNGSTASEELSEGANTANYNNVALFVSLHMNASNGQGHGTEALVSSTSSGAYSYANNLCINFSNLGFTNRGVKTSTGFYEMNHIAAPNIIFEICFCDSETDIAIYNKYSLEKLAYAFANALDNNIPKDALTLKFGWNQDSTGWWYCTDLDNQYYYKDVWKEIDKDWYSFDSRGYARESVWLNDKGKWYYLKDSCKMAKSESLWINSNCYCFDENGSLYVDSITADDQKVDDTEA